MATGLTPKRARFVDEFLLDLNATQAAKRAGYSKKTARSQGQRLLTNVDIAAAIKTKRDERSKRTGITADWVLHELRNLAGANILDYVTVGENGLPSIDLTNMTRDQAAALRGLKASQIGAGDGPVAMKVDIRLADKKAALELLGRHLGMFSTKHELSGPDGGPIEVATPDSLDLARRIAFVLAKAQRELSKKTA